MKKNLIIILLSTTLVILTIYLTTQNKQMPINEINSLESDSGADADSTDWKGNLPAEVIEIVAEKSIPYVGSDKIVKVEAKKTHTNFSRTDRVTDYDYLLEISVTTDWWKSDHVIVCAFIDTGSNELIESDKYDGKQPEHNYTCVYKEVFGGPSVSLISLLLDGRVQLMIKEDVSGNSATAILLWIYNFNQETGEFDLIFNEGLDEGVAFVNYSYDSYLTFLKNEQNQYDIRFKVIAHTRSETYEYNILSEKEILFRFDGVTYKPIRDFFDYRLPIKETHPDYILLERERRF